MSDENKKTDKKTNELNQTEKADNQESEQKKQEKKKKRGRKKKQAKEEKADKKKEVKNAETENQVNAKKRGRKKKAIENKNSKVENYVDPIQFSKIYENKDVREILLKHFEKGCVDLLPELIDYAKDEIIANKKDIKAPIIRKWLNLLHEKSIVEFTRKKDKKTGWFTYFWKIRPDKIIEFTVSDIDNEIKELEKKIEEIKAHNFACGCRTWTYNEALESDFVCPKCEKVIVEKDNSELIKEMEDKKKVLEEKKKDILSLVEQR